VPQDRKHRREQRPGSNEMALECVSRKPKLCAVAMPQWRCRSGDAAGRRTHRRDLHAHAHELKLLPEPAGQRARQQVGGQVPAIEKAHAMRENQTGSHTTSKKRNTIAATLRAVRGRRPNGHTVHAQSCVGVRQQTMKTLCAVAHRRNLHAQVDERSRPPERAGQRARQQVGGRVPTPAGSRKHTRRQIREHQPGSRTAGKKRNTMAATLRTASRTRRQRTGMRADNMTGMTAACPTAGCRQGTCTTRSEATQRKGVRLCQQKINTISAKQLCAVAMPQADALTNGTTATHRSLSELSCEIQLGSEPDSLLASRFLRPQDSRATQTGPPLDERAAEHAGSK
jgi:hypothetical protein